MLNTLKYGLISLLLVIINIFYLPFLFNPYLYLIVSGILFIVSIEFAILALLTIIERKKEAIYDA
mgnify:CR=1 FL=1